MDGPVAREIAQRDSRNGHELRQSGERASMSDGGDLADVRRHDAQEDALAEAADAPPGDELGLRGRRALYQCAGTEQNRSGDDDLEPAVLVREMACEHGGNGPREQDDGDGEPEQRAENVPTDCVNCGIDVMAPMEPVSKPFSKPPRETATEASTYLGGRYLKAMIIISRS